MPLKATSAQELCVESFIRWVSMAEQLLVFFLGFVLGPLVPVKDNDNAKAYKDFLDNCMHPTFWQQLWEGPFPCSSMNVPLCTKRGP